MKTSRKTAGIIPAQIKKLHALKNALGLDDPTYREVLASCGVNTSKALTFSGAEEIIDRFERDAVTLGVWKRIPSRQVGQGLRSGFASAAQLDLIHLLWEEISTAPAEQRSRALRKFVTRQAKVSDLRFLRDSDASRVICALKAMKEQAAGS